MKVSILSNFCFVFIYVLFIGIISSKVFALLIDQEESRVFMKVYFNRLPLEKFTNKVGNTMKTLFALVFDMQKIEINKGE